MRAKGSLGSTKAGFSLLEANQPYDCILPRMQAAQAGTLGGANPIGRKASSQARLKGLSDVAYEALRTEIVRGVLRPNDRLVELELADRLRMSRTPVRETLQKLANDGLVLSTPHGWAVKEHQPDEIRHIYETRAALESFAAYLASQRATPEQLRRLASLEPLVPASGALEGISRDDLVDRNNAFHDAVIEAAGNPVLTEMITRTRTYFFNYRLAHLYTSKELRASSQGHRRLLDALRNHDAAAAERITRDHILEALEVTLHRLV
jgi:DNA-binding GntR family transcriptional regulator